MHEYVVVSNMPHAECICALNTYKEDVPCYSIMRKSYIVTTLLNLCYIIPELSLRNRHWAAPNPPPPPLNRGINHLGVPSNVLSVHSGSTLVGGLSMVTTNFPT